MTPNNSPVADDLKAFESFPLIQTQFEYIEISLIKRHNLYTIAYSYIKPDHERKVIVASCMIETAMTGFSYAECVTSVNNLLKLNFFKIPVMANGVVYNDQLDIIESINWNTVTPEDNQQPTTVH